MALGDALYPLDPALVPPPGVPVGEPFATPTLPPPPDAPVAPPPPVDASLPGLPSPWAPYGVAIPPELVPPPIVPGMEQAAPPPPPDAPVAPPPPALTPAPVPPPPLPDAITGQVERSLVGPPDQPFTGDARQALTPEQRYQQVAKGYAGNPDALLADLISGPVTPERQRYLNELALRDQQGFAELGLRLDDARQKQVAARQLEIRNRDFDQQMANARARDAAMKATQAKLDQVIADAQRIAATKNDPTGGLSTGQKIAGVLGAVVGGLVQGRTGSPNNAGLDALNTAINRGIQAQQADLANQREGLNLRRTALAEQIHLNNDAYQAAETVRLAALMHADDLLKTQQQDFASDGTRGLRIAQLRAGIAAQQATTLREIGQKSFDNHIKQQNADREATLAIETLRHNRATEGLEAAKFTLEKTKAKAQDQAFDPEVLARILPPGSPVPPIPMSIKEYNTWAEAGTKGQQLRNQAPENVRAVPGVPIKDAAGKESTFIATGEPTEVGKLKKKVAATTKIVNLIDEAIRKRTGWSSEVGNSDEKQQLDAIWGQAKIEAKNAAELGQITESDVELIKGMLGTGNPSKLRDPIPGMREARALLLQGLNTDLKSFGYPQDQRFDILDTSSPPAASKTAEDRALQLVLSAQNDKIGTDQEARQGFTFEQQQALDQWGADLGVPLPQGTYVRSPDDGEHAKLQAQIATDLQRQAGDPLRVKAEAAAKELEQRRTGALESLHKAANDATSPGVRAYAQQILLNQVSQGIDAIPLPGGR